MVVQLVPAIWHYVGETLEALFVLWVFVTSFKNTGGNRCTNESAQIVVFKKISF